MTDGNGSSGKSLSSLGAPHWFCEAERRRAEEYKGLENRVSSLEQAVIKGGASAGAKAGRRWGAFLGALIATASSVGINSCDKQPATKADYQP